MKYALSRLCFAYTGCWWGVWSHVRREAEQLPREGLAQRVKVPSALCVRGARQLPPMR